MVLRNVPADIRTKFLQDTSFKRYGYVNQFGLLSGLMAYVLVHIPLCPVLRPRSSQFGDN
jgi:hypothetical protein